MQISRVVLVADVKISQLGRKKLAVRFNLIMDDGPEQGGQDDYDQTSRRERRQPRNRKPRKSISSPAAQAPCGQCRGEQFGIVAVRAVSGLMSSAGALAKAVRLGESQRPLPVQAIGVQVNSP
jgi:hypothetical protein